MILPRPPLLLITDRTLSPRPLAETVRAAFEGGCRWVMVREKDLPTADLAALARDIVALADGYGATVSVNGDVEAARDADADGVHLPQGRSVAEARAALGAEKLVGVSCHSPAEAQTAEADGADYVTISPIFPTDSKPGYGPALGLDMLEKISAAVGIPAVALAGIDAGNAGDCLRRGAAGVAVMGGIMRAADPARAAAALVDSLSGIKP